MHSVDTSGKAIRVSANQSDIAEGTYPFIRTITAVTHYGFDDDLVLRWRHVRFDEVPWEKVTRRAVWVDPAGGFAPRRIEQRRLEGNKDSCDVTISQVEVEKLP